MTLLVIAALAMRFRFLGGSDAPDWILAEVSILAKMVTRSKHKDKRSQSALRRTSATS